MVLKVQKQGCTVMFPYFVQPHSAALAMEPTCKGVALFPTSGSIKSALLITCIANIPVDAVALFPVLMPMLPDVRKSATPLHVGSITNEETYKKALQPCRRSFKCIYRNKHDVI